VRLVCDLVDDVIQDVEAEAGQRSEDVSAVDSKEVE
jgi:hypothetical protein